MPIQALKRSYQLHMLSSSIFINDFAGIPSLEGIARGSSFEIYILPSFDRISAFFYSRFAEDFKRVYIIIVKRVFFF